MRVLKSIERMGVAVLLAATALLGVALFGSPSAKALGIGESGYYSFGGAGCDENDHTDPIGALFRGKGAWARNVGDQIGQHVGWREVVSGSDQWLWVHTGNGNYDCRMNNYQVADHGNVPPSGRNHIRLWFVPASDKPEYKTVGTPHHEDLTFCGHAVDSNGPEGSGFDQARRQLRQGFESAPHHNVITEDWGNTANFKQCDGDMAGSNGSGVVITVNHQLEVFTGKVSSSTTSLMLSGTVLTWETATEWWFSYGPNPSQGVSGYPYKTAVKSTSATGEFNVNEAIPRLCPNATYYVRAFARNQDGEVEEGNEIQYQTCDKDLYGVLMNRAGSGRTEIHILDGASNYSTFRSQVPTALGEATASQWWFAYGDYNRDGIPDLYGILMNGPTGTGKTELHIFDGATNYSTALLRVGTGLGETTASQWQYAVGDYNRDGRPDLYGVLMNGPTGTGKTELHIFDGATNYSTALLRVGTALSETRPQQWQFSAGDYNGDGITDVLGVLMNGPTGTGKTELHILNGASNYSSFLLETGTALGETTASQWQFGGAHVSGDWRPVASTEPATGIGTEGAVLNGVVNPRGLSTTYHFEYGTTTSYGSSTAESGSLGNGVSNVAVNRAISGLSSGTTYHFRVVAKNLEGTSYGSDRTFKTAATGTAGQLGGMAVTEPFNGSSSSLANFSGNWSPLGWASGISPKGEDTTAGWRPVDAHPTVNGAFYEPTITDTGPGIAAVATMATNPSLEGRHFSLWLDMPSPSSATKAGYELRFTNVSSGLYNVTLSRWQSGTETVLASKSSYAFANGNSFALVDQGGTVSAWTNTGAGFGQLLSAGDASFSGGGAGVQGAGNITRLTNFKAGALLTPVANMDAALKALPVNAAFSTNENPLSGGGSWAALAWDNSTSGHNTGWVSGGWGPYDAYSTINGAYWQKASFADSGAGDAVTALLYGNPTIASRYFSLWLNAPTPGSTRSGYELRFTETSTNVYEVALSRWQSGIRTVLASKLGYSFPIGSQFALTAKGGTVSGWTNTGSVYTQLLSAADSTYISGYTGIEGSGNIIRLKDFRSGPLAPF